MRRLKTSIAAWSAMFAILAFVIASAVLPDEGVRNISYALVTGFTSAGVIRWMPDALRSFRNGRAGAEFLIVGVAALLTILLLHRVWIVVKTFFPQIDDAMVTYFVVWMMAWACGLILVAPDVQDGVIANRSLMLVGAALFIAGLMSGVSIALTLG